ncbi:MAG: hypothetical protein M0Z99_27750 [Betaproteobacteria bacterium]|nr:hypothetical protein [Betaproteobacteria bacterium]
MPPARLASRISAAAPVRKGGGGSGGEQGGILGGISTATTETVRGGKLPASRLNRR